MVGSPAASFVNEKKPTCVVDYFSSAPRGAGFVGAVADLLAARLSSLNRNGSPPTRSVLRIEGHQYFSMCSIAQIACMRPLLGRVEIDARDREPRPGGEICGNRLAQYLIAVGLFLLRPLFVPDQVAHRFCVGGVRIDDYKQHQRD